MEIGIGAVRNPPPAEAPGQALRRAARRFATGVTILAVDDAGQPHALTANSFVTLSLEPALVGVAVRTDGRMRALAEQVGRFGISILHAGQGRYARHYARRDRGAGPALAGDLVPGCVAYFACELHCIYPVGDHDLIVGEVTACDVPDAAGRPLIFLDGGYHEAVPALRGEQQ